METKNLILATVGDNSYHKEWINGNNNFDLILIYYGDNNDIFLDYRKDAMLCINQKGQKYPMIKNFIIDNTELLSKYDHIWLPDDDLLISTNAINSFFNIAKQHGIILCQPALINNQVAHPITKINDGTLFRYTNFVEVMAPLFTYESLMMLCNDFDLSESGWGLDVTWAYRLNYPHDKIAIIDATPMQHMRPIGNDYSRFKKSPHTELVELLAKYNLPGQIFNGIKNYTFIQK